MNNLVIILNTLAIIFCGTVCIYDISIGYYGFAVFQGVLCLMNLFSLIKNSLL